MELSGQPLGSELELALQNSLGDFSPQYPCYEKLTTTIKLPTDTKEITGIL